MHLSISFIDFKALIEEMSSFLQTQIAHQVAQFIFSSFPASEDYKILSLI